MTGEVQIDDILTEYHPQSGLPPKVAHFEDYGRDEDSIEDLLVHRDPTATFGSRVEFEFAELALEACLNRKQLDRLLAIVHKIRSGAEFRFRKHQDVEDAWDIAAKWHVPVSQFDTNNLHTLPLIQPV